MDTTFVYGRALMDWNQLLQRSKSVTIKLEWETMKQKLWPKKSTSSGWESMTSWMKMRSSGNNWVRMLQKHYPSCFSVLLDSTDSFKAENARCNFGFLLVLSRSSAKAGSGSDRIQACQKPQTTPVQSRKPSSCQRGKTRSNRFKLLRFVWSDLLFLCLVSV